MRLDSTNPVARPVRRVLVGSVVLASALAGCGDADGPQHTSRVTGTIEIVDTSHVGMRNKGQTLSCYGQGVYVGVREGARVVVEDASGSEVSAGRLGQGRLVYDPRDLEQGGPDQPEPQSCLIGFVVQGVPPVGDSWSIRIGTRRFDLPPEQTTNLTLTLGQS